MTNVKNPHTPKRLVRTLFGKAQAHEHTPQSVWKLLEKARTHPLPADVENAITMMESSSRNLLPQMLFLSHTTANPNIPERLRAIKTTFTNVTIKAFQGDIVLGQMPLTTFVKNNVHYPSQHMALAAQKSAQNLTAALKSLNKHLQKSPFCPWVDDHIALSATLTESMIGNTKNTSHRSQYGWDLRVTSQHPAFENGRMPPIHDFSSSEKDQTLRLQTELFRLRLRALTILENIIQDNTKGFQPPNSEWTQHSQKHLSCVLPLGLDDMLKTTTMGLWGAQNLRVPKPQKSD